MGVIHLKHAQARRDMQRICKERYPDKVKPFIEAIEYKAAGLNCSYGTAKHMIESELIAHGANPNCITMLNAAYCELELS